MARRTAAIGKTAAVRSTGVRETGVRETGVRETTGRAGYMGPSGIVFVEEDGSGRRGYIGNNVPIEGARFVDAGTHLMLEVEDKGDAMVVVKAAVIGG